MKIAIIGAGPRGLILLNQLVKEINEPAQIDIYDPFPVGGRVWRTDQSLSLIMNSTAQLITLFNDLNETQPTGPSLYDWLKTDTALTMVKEADNAAELTEAIQALEPNDFPARALFGFYAKWFYQQTLQKLPENIQVNFHQELVTSLDKTEAGFSLATNQLTQSYDQVIISTGASNNEPSADAQSLQKYASENELTYYTPSYANEHELAEITADQTVLLRGLGLNFFDYLTKLTLDRGGYYTTTKADTLVYHPSGKEPKMVVGSRRGVPYFPKPKNQLAVSEHRHLQFLNETQIKQHLVDGKLPYADFYRLFKAEIEFQHYQILLPQKYEQINLAEFNQAFVANPNPAEIAEQFKLNPEDQLNWELLANPVAGTAITTIESYQKILLQWIDIITNDAKSGANNAPITGALSTIVDLRTTIQALVAKHYFTADEYLNQFLGEFVTLTNFLTSGPPVERYQQLRALMQAGIVTILGPQLQVIGANHKFIGRSKFYPKEIFSADALIEARLPSANLTHTTNPVLNQLKQAGILTNYQFKLNDGQVKTSPAVNVDQNSYHPINSQGNVETHLYLWGVPLSGLEWLETALPHILSNDRNFQVATLITNKIKEQIHER
ncbi:FAD/NAD(P)-binding protein [Fructilactobacillus vespulae]|uniref:FAD/NAD(P)-binding protein n=1 Tax=Fructilactobacillus vespulae TaxID=1249630 RepID=UPI0039B5DB56